MDIVSPDLHLFFHMMDHFIKEAGCLDGDLSADIDLCFQIDLLNLTGHWASFELSRELLFHMVDHFSNEAGCLGGDLSAGMDLCFQIDLLNLTGHWASFELSLELLFDMLYQDQAGSFFVLGQIGSSL